MLYLPEIEVNGTFFQDILKNLLSGDTILRIDYDKIDRIIM